MVTLDSTLDNFVLKNENVGTSHKKTRARCFLTLTTYVDVFSNRKRK